MTKEDITYLYQKMKEEGFDYCFRKYSTFEEIDDPEFHKLREAYCNEADKLESYVCDMYELADELDNLLECAVDRCKTKAGTSAREPNIEQLKLNDWVESSKGWICPLCAEEIDE